MQLNEVSVEQCWDEFITQRHRKKTTINLAYGHQCSIRKKICIEKELRNYKNYYGWFLEDAHRLLTVYIMETVIYTANWEFLKTNDQWWHYHVLPRTFLQPLPRAIIEESFKKRIWRYLWKKLKSWDSDCELQLKI